MTSGNRIIRLSPDHQRKINQLVEASPDRFRDADDFIFRAIDVFLSWEKNPVKVIDKLGQNKSYSSISYKSSFNGEIIANLFSNLNSLNLYQLYELSENYSKIGYSTTNVMVHLNKLL